MTTDTRLFGKNAWLWFAIVAYGQGVEPNFGCPINRLSAIGVVLGVTGVAFVSHGEAAMQ